MENIPSHSKIEVNEFMVTRQTVLKFCKIALKNKIERQISSQEKNRTNLHEEVKKYTL